ncbi:MAG TPA: bifunctional 4-hydroxy-2-oxoglutarate aldolase/2-dehydro-3-deoxy-phosphogluconate aldolase [Lysobacter sp.]
MGLIESVLHAAPVMPVVVIEDAKHAVPLARALVAGGIPAIEVTLRTRAALDAVRAISAEVEGAIVGVGTVLRPQDFVDAERAGARFAVSPGSTATLIAAANEGALPWLPGAATASEAMALAEHGFVFQKFFPAEAAGGTAALKSLHGPLPQIRFCATGGIGIHNARDYLATPNVACVGGSWLTPAKLMADGDWAGIEALARAAAGLRG